MQFLVCATSRDYYPQFPLHAVSSPLSIIIPQFPLHAVSSPPSITHCFLYTRIPPRTILIIFTRRFHYTRFPLLALSTFPLAMSIIALLKMQFFSNWTKLGKMQMTRFNKELSYCKQVAQQRRVRDRNAIYHY